MTTLSIEIEFKISQKILKGLIKDGLNPGVLTQLEIMGRKAQLVRAHVRSPDGIPFVRVFKQPPSPPTRGGQ